MAGELNAPLVELYGSDEEFSGTVVEPPELPLASGLADKPVPPGDVARRRAWRWGRRDPMAGPIRVRWNVCAGECSEAKWVCSRRWIEANGLGPRPAWWKVRHRLSRHAVARRLRRRSCSWASMGRRSRPDSAELELGASAADDESLAAVLTLGCAGRWAPQSHRSAPPPARGYSERIPFGERSPEGPRAWRGVTRGWLLSLCPRTGRPWTVLGVAVSRHHANLGQALEVRQRPS